MEKTRNDRRGKKGAVSMEYVLVAVLIAAAAVAAVVVFGRTVVLGFGVIGRSAAGDGQSGWNAVTSDEDYRQQLERNRKEATALNEKFSEVDRTSSKK